MEKCDKYQERISAFLDGLLTEEERLELMEHMASCSACQQYFDDQIAIHDALTGLEADAPQGFTDAVMARVRETKQDAPEKKTIAFPHWRRWAVTAACCAVAALGVMGLGGRHELGPAVSQNAVSYDLARSESVSVTANTSAADDTPAAYTTETNEPATQTESAPYALPDDSSDQTTTSFPAPDAARVDTDVKSMETAQPTVLSTTSPLAEQWVEETLSQPWQTGSSYTLTAAQFDELRGRLDAAGAPYTMEAAENDDFLLLAE